MFFCTLQLYPTDNIMDMDMDFRLIVLFAFYVKRKLSYFILEGYIYIGFFCNYLFIVASCSAKIVIHLHPAPLNKEPGPYQHSKYPFIKLSFKEHGQIEVVPFIQPTFMINQF